MLSPFAKGFKVTPKGTASDRYSFNWQLAWPLLVLFVLTAISLWVNLGMCMINGAWTEAMPTDVAMQSKGIGLGWIWSSYNLIMLGIALLILLDVPQPSPYQWFDLRRTVRLQFMAEPGTPDLSLWGVTTMISEIGVEIAVTEAGFPRILDGETIPVQLEILEYQLLLQGQATQTGLSGEFPTVRVTFEHLDIIQQRQLVKMLFCRPGQWKNRHTPGEFQSLLLLLRAFLRPRILFDRNIDVCTVSVAQV
jgi:cellulose synthase (UDP-forming)